MNPIQKLKQRKNWIYIVIIVIVGVFLWSSNLKSQSTVTLPTQEVCNQCGAGLLNLCSASECHNLGCVTNPNDLVFNSCQPCLPTGYVINAKSFWNNDELFVRFPDVYPDKMCCSGAVSESTYLINSFHDYTCVDASIGCSSSFERSIAKIGAFVAKGDTVPCKTKFMTGLGVIGFAGILLIAII